MRSSARNPANAAAATIVKSVIGRRNANDTKLIVPPQPVAAPGRPSAPDNRSPPSAFKLVLLVPQRVIEIDDTLIKGATARVEAHISAGQTRLCPISLIGAFEGIGALGSTRRQ